MVGVVSAFFSVGFLFLIYLSAGLSKSNQAVVLATLLSSVGTLLLALATFYNILQTNRTLELREKEQEKPLVKDELSYLIQPAITSLENNLREFKDSDSTGCVFEWPYIESSRLYNVSRGPTSVRTPDSLPMARLASDDRELYGTLRAHDNYVESIAEEASKLHQELKPEIERLLEEEGIDEVDQSLKVFTSAVLKEIDHFDESHDQYDFWEKYGDHLIEYANQETDSTQEEVKSGEEVYRKFLQNALQELEQRKAILKQEYSISEDEISPDEDELWEGW